MLGQGLRPQAVTIGEVAKRSGVAASALRFYEERGLIVHLGAEFYPPALPPPPVEQQREEEEDEPQPIVEGQPTIFEPNPPPPKPKKAAPRKRVSPGGGVNRRPRKRKPE